MIVFDSSAIIAYFQSEKGNEVVDEYLQKDLSAISTVNFCETILKLKQSQLDTDIILIEIGGLEFNIIDCTKEISLLATEITHPENMFLSLGDRICLATTIHHKSSVLTGDSNWKKLKLPIEVIAIR